MGHANGGNKVALNPVGADGNVGEPKQVIPTGLNAHAFLPSPDNHFVFATNLGSDQILGFRLDAATGALTPNDPAAIKVAEKRTPALRVSSQWQVRLSCQRTECGAISLFLRCHAR